RTRPQLRDGVVGRARRQRHVRQRRVHRAGRCHRGAVRDEQVRYAMHLVVRVQHGFRRVVAHARAAHLVDGDAGNRPHGNRHDVLGAGRDEHPLRLFGRVELHAPFVLAVRHVEAQLRQAEAAPLVLVQRHAVVLLRQLFAERAEERDPFAGPRDLVLRLRAETVRLRGRIRPVVAHGAALVAVAAREVGVRVLAADVAEARHEDARGTAAAVVAVLETGDLREHAHARVVDEVAPQHVAVVADAVRVQRALRLQQDLQGAVRGRIQEDHLRAKAQALARLRIDDAHAGGLLRLRVDVDRFHDAVRADREQARLLRGRQRGAQRAEIRAERAAAVADVAPLARAAAVQRFRQVGHAADRHAAVLPLRLDGALEVFFQRRHLERRQVVPVGEVRQPFRRAAHADEFFHVRVPRFQVRVADRPVIAVPVAFILQEVVRAPAVRLAAPRERAAAQHVGAVPAERFHLLVRVLAVVDPVLAVGPAERAALDPALDFVFARVQHA
ncbi:conserved hypothetical protein, partial [Ricinus communis]